MSFVKKGNAQILLFINALLWGSSYVWAKLLLDYIPRFTILSICSIGGLITTTVLFFPLIRKLRLEEILPSLVVTVFSIISNTLNMFALQYTSSSNTAFILQSSVVMTPVIMAILDKHMPKGKVIASAFIALAGVFLITCSSKGLMFNIGDVFAILNALFFSFFLIGQNKISEKVNPVRFTFLHHAINTVVFFLLSGILEFKTMSFEGLNTYMFLLPAAASIVVAATTILFQSAAIKFVRPERATVIYTLEPLMALILGSIQMGSQLDGRKSILGCFMIIAAVILSTVRVRMRKKSAAKVSPIGMS
jgi:drug/metabolite transporter (DMT)-like permease